jgi:hypothetical protein
MVESYIYLKLRKDKVVENKKTHNKKLNSARSTVQCPHWSTAFNHQITERPRWQRISKRHGPRHYIKELVENIDRTSE